MNLFDMTITLPRESSWKVRLGFIKIWFKEDKKRDQGPSPKKQVELLFTTDLI